MGTVLFPAGLLGLALTMLMAHARSWRRVRARPLSAFDLAFRKGQFRRRMQASSLLALIAPTMLVGTRLSAQDSPRIFVTLWLVVALATLWVTWLALLDALASGRYFHRLSHQRSVDRDRLRGELDRLFADARAARERPDSAANENAQA